MSPEVALDIIASHGADSRRWPVESRAALLALAARDTGVAAALADARRIDAMIDGWVGDVAPRSFDVAAITRLPQEPRTAPPVVAAPRQRPALPLRWIGGGALAAALAGVMLVMAPMEQRSTTVVASVSPGMSVPSATDGNADGRDAEVFASVFTPTPDEEQVI